MKIISFLITPVAIFFDKNIYVDKEETLWVL